MSRKALPCKACVERSDYFRAARRHKNNDIISGCRKKPEVFFGSLKGGAFAPPPSFFHIIHRTAHAAAKNPTASAHSAAGMAYRVRCMPAAPKYTATV